MSSVDVDAVMGGLKKFQRAAVDHVIHQFYGPGCDTRSGRFLIADETGLGKSIVAKGVIAKAIEHLEQDDSIDRIDVVYVCSNADLARQNLRRLNVTGEDHIGMATRLTLMARESGRLQQASEDGGKKVNLVSFTPGTSFSEGGWRQGSAEERAMLTLILDHLVNATDAERLATRLLFHGTVKTARRFDEHYVEPLAADLDGKLDARSGGACHEGSTGTGQLERFVELRDQLNGRHEKPDVVWNKISTLIADLRQTLAKASVEALEPDLIILDEFQRFRHLLDPNGGDAADLAHALFDHGNAKVLLLSATPYKPFTNHTDTGEDHATDFLATIRFLSGEDPAAETAVRGSLSNYRQALVLGQDAQAAAKEASRNLIPYMTRSERPPISTSEDLVQVRHMDTATPTENDIREWSMLHRLGTELDAPIDLEYWKSVPYFVNFMDGYKPGERLKSRLDDGDMPASLESTRSLSRTDIESFAAVDLGNGHLRALAAETVGSGWWRLLWLPPTMPYLTPGPVFSQFKNHEVTKRVIFSAWSAVPTAVASLLSYEADRCVAGDKTLLKENTPEGRKAVGARLNYRLGPDKRPAAMSTLALFWPHPGLAALGDQLAAARAAEDCVDAREFVAGIDEKLPNGEETGSAWEAYFAAPGMVPPTLEHASERLLLGDGAADGASQHVSLARAAARGGAVSGAKTHPDLAGLVAFGPGNIALRSLHTVAGPDSTPEGLWRAALELARGLRTLFNRTETVALLETLYGDGRPYWRWVLDYCADGNLRAVLDEYLFQLRSELGGESLDDAGLLSVAQSAADVLGLHPARYLAKDNSPERGDIPFNARFAVRYGGKAQSDADEKSGVRQGEVRAAFNSPFTPFVLASTSVGQEGIDFHWWSHSVLHWNLPSNPVDFEQREGRVNRFAGHVVRKNVASEHWPDVLKSGDQSPWNAAFRAAEAQQNGLGEFSPWWVFPGAARIDRVLTSYPFSRDAAKYERLRHDLTLYRLTLGQPRQEDMVELLAKRGTHSESWPTIDLSPPGITD